MRSLFPAQESNLGGWDENQESQPLDQQETVAGTKLALAVVATNAFLKKAKTVKTGIMFIIRDTAPVGELTEKWHS